MLVYRKERITSIVVGSGPGSKLVTFYDEGTERENRKMTSGRRKRLKVWTCLGKIKEVRKSNDPFKSLGPVDLDNVEALLTETLNR